ncbi:hypothetical protein [Aurantimonas sp. VKM B-3413]|uniref:hypothetical protein n=1 Tax=Aurantimonas sp. VKM B-3413 TaxID=2779401 RepID=UPI001E35193C|nr:hypothetical protein [Aurantimonas sp. VKM B-3413]
MSEIGTGLFRATLLFGMLGLALALILAPAVDRGAGYLLAGDRPALDMMATGSIGSSTRYTVSRSVLQPAGAPPCIFYPGGPGGGRC